MLPIITTVNCHFLQSQMDSYLIHPAGNLYEGEGSVQFTSLLK